MPRALTGHGVTRAPPHSRRAQITATSCRPSGCSRRGGRGPVAAGSPKTRCRRCRTTRSRPWEGAFVPERNRLLNDAFRSSDSSSRHGRRFRRRRSESGQREWPQAAQEATSRYRASGPVAPHYLSTTPILSWSAASCRTLPSDPRRSRRGNRRRSSLRTAPDRRRRPEHP